MLDPSVLSQLPPAIAVALRQGLADALVLPPVDSATAESLADAEGQLDPAQAAEGEPWPAITDPAAASGVAGPHPTEGTAERDASER